MKVANRLDSQAILVEARLNAELAAQLPRGVVARRMHMACRLVKPFDDCPLITKPLATLLRVITRKISDSCHDFDPIGCLWVGPEEVVFCQFAN